ncbi:hypothetical protein [Natrinema versiforme]|uniref:hypothetical protein n=1 Tax=Natrinema versiforme TaxID=88724 RepID=UPI0012680639|nr:hypothetical protein [Natrinema versiforme]
MNRRTLLAVVTASIATISGCIGGRNNGSEGNYEPCNARVVSYLQLPEGVKDEVDIAFEEGQYSTRGELLWEKIDAPELQAIEKDDDYFSPIVDTNGVFPLKETTLQFEKTTPQYDEPVNLSIYQSVADTLTISITVEYEGRVVNKEQNIRIQEKVNPYSTDYEDKSVRPNILTGRKYGRYTFDIAIEGRENITEIFQIGSSHYTHTPTILYIQEENSSISVAVTRRVGGDPAPCPW